MASGVKPHHQSPPAFVFRNKTLRHTPSDGEWFVSFQEAS